MPARRFKLPVLSRLAWAWLGFSGLALGAVFVAANDGGRTRAAVAMAVEGIELLAPAESRRRPADPPLERLVEPSPVEKDAFAAEEPFAIEATDAFADAGGAAVPYEDPAADIVITVDGAPARAIGEAPARKPAAAPQPIASPDEGLLRRSAYGQAPRIGADGRRPSKVYAQQFAPGKNPNVAVIVGGLGLNRALTERAIDDLPPQVTLAFAPYARDLVFWTKRARDAGHEIMIEIPMENRASDAEALGPAALLTVRSAEENAQRLDWILSRFQGYFGATNYLGAKFSGDRDAIEGLLARLDAAGLAYVDDTGVIAREARRGDVGAVDRLVDPGFGDKSAQTKRDLEALEKIAKREGDALGKTYAHDATLDDIVAWAQSLDEKGLTLAPASGVLALRAGDR
jgi:hypothetical protein